MFAALAILIASGYPPPSDRDATRAIAAIIAAERGYDVDMLTTMPVEARVLRCAWTETRDALSGDGFWRAHDGHVCIVDIESPGEPVFQTEAFFSHDGMAWAFFGSTRAPLIVEPSSYGFDEPLSRLSPKEGAIRYDGLAGAFQEYDPYARIMGDHPTLGDPTPWTDSDNLVGESPAPPRQIRR
jgi:hypothetical protein